jgi:hypothetical protein
LISLSNKRPFAFEIEGNKFTVNIWLDMLLKTVGILYGKNPEKMKNLVTDDVMNGCKVHNLFLSPQATIRKSIKISNADFYVETNGSGTLFKRKVGAPTATDERRGYL